MARPKKGKPGAPPPKTDAADDAAERQRQIELRRWAHFLTDNPDEIGAKWRREICLLLQEYLALSPQPRLTPKDVARLVDENIAYQEERGAPHPVGAARTAIAVTTDKPVTAVKAAHLRFGTRGVTKPPKKSR